MGKILIVCTGNICRSPMAEGLLTEALRARGVRSVAVESAGTSAVQGSRAAPEAVAALAEREIDISGHRTQRLVQPLLDTADLVIGMTGDHVDRALEIVPEAEGRSFMLKELVRLLDDFRTQPGTGDPDERLAQAAAWADRKREEGATGGFDQDVSDPLGLGLESFRASAWEIEGLVSELMDELFGQAWDRAAPDVSERTSEAVWGTTAKGRTG